MKISGRFSKAFVLFSMVGVTCPVKAATEITCVGVTSEPLRTIVTIELKSAFQYQIGRESGLERFYIDFLDATLADAIWNREIDVGDHFLSQIHINVYGNSSTRLVFDVSPGVQRAIHGLADPHRLVIHLTSNPSQLRARSNTNSVAITRLSRPPRIDDFLSGTSPFGYTAVTGFRQRTPGDGDPASHEAIAYLAYDQTNLYVVFVCDDEPGKVRAHLAKREEITNDDTVAVFLDTFHDQRRAYVFASNALGVQRDGIVTEGQNTDYGFDTLWHAEGRLTADGFIVLMAIPFKSLRFSGTPVQHWGIALNRQIVRTNEDTYWPYITDRTAGFLQQIAMLDGVEHVSPGRNLQLIPYVALARARVLDRAIPMFVNENDTRGGLDSKIVIKDAFTVDLTMNPDFSQVESDDPQVTINQRYEVFFPEKRPFFIENAGFFRTPLNLFFSRRIVDPRVGARVTGKIGNWDIGVLATDDRAPGKLLSGGLPSHTSFAGIGVASVRRDFGKQSSIGILATSRDFASSSNRVFSLDTRLRLSSNWFFNGQVVRSFTRKLDGRHFAGPAYSAELIRSGRHFVQLARYTDISPNFASELGFIRRVDIRTHEQYASYRWRPERGPILSFGPAVSALINSDRTRRLQDWVVNAEFTMELARQTGLTFGRYDNFEYFAQRGFRKRGVSVNAYTGLWKWLSFSAYYNQGGSINYSPASGLAPFLGDSVNSTLGFTFRPIPRFRLDQMYIYSGLRTHSGSLPGKQLAPTSIFNNHLLRSKVNYQFTRALSARLIADYNATLPNMSLVALEKSKAISGDVLLTYLLNPGTALYVGYTTRYDNLAIEQGVTPRLVPKLVPNLPTSRQFFVKLSYLLRF
jgi:hypothetical protein